MFLCGVATQEDMRGVQNKTEQSIKRINEMIKMSPLHLYTRQSDHRHTD